MKSVSKCLTLRDPMDCSLPDSSIHGIFQARVLEWVAIAFSDDKPRQHIKKKRNYFADKGLSSQSYGFSRKEYWSGVPLPSPFSSMETIKSVPPPPHVKIKRMNEKSEKRKLKKNVKQKKNKFLCQAQIKRQRN